MAGSCKPNVQGLGKEARYKVIGFYSSGGVQDGKGLFDGELDDSSCDSVKGFLWGNSRKSYLEIEIYDDCNIWRCGTYSWDFGNAPTLTIQKYHDGKYVDITNNIIQKASRVTFKQWERTIENLPKGRYKFESTGDNRYDSEWYLESINTTKYLIKYNNQYYNLKEFTYDKTNKVYNPISINNMDEKFLEDNCIDDLEMLTKEITIDTEIFKPISKFKEFQIVTIDSEQTDSKLQINGLKTDKQMIVANNDILKKIVRNIDWFELKTNISDNGKVKIVFSNDKGISWYTYDTDKFVKLYECVIPVKEFEKLNEDEKKQWNKIMNLIGEKGLDSTAMKSVDFNKLDGETLRFAYVIQRPKYTDKAEVDELSWQFDAKGSMLKMMDSEYEVESCNNSIKFKSNIDNELIKINIATKLEEKESDGQCKDFDIESLPRF